MATRYWRSGGVDFGLAGNWHDGVYGASAAPASADTLYMTEGSDAITAGLTQTAVDLAKLLITNGFSGRIGGAGSSLIVAVDNTNTGLVEYGAGGGYMYLTAGTNNLYQVRVNGAGLLYLTGGTVENLLEISSGGLNVNDSTALNGITYRQFGGESVIDYKGSDTPTTVDVRGGTLVLRRPVTTLNIYEGGSVVIQCEKAATAATTINMQGGKLDHRCGTITNFNALSGYFTFENAIRDITLTTVSVSVAAKWGLLQGRNAKVTWPTVTPIGARVIPAFTV